MICAVQEGVREVRCEIDDGDGSCKWNCQIRSIDMFEGDFPLTKL